ncbi:hypothetical protein B0H19DRAFT_1080774 [Mycena capillaripes]|nr:hypothetical protein B0H19DRAFT_1080774 [Mycena capillaripes]
MSSTTTMTASLLFLPHRSCPEVALGGRVVSCREEIESAILFFCDSMWDTDFIAIWYNETFRVLSKRYIFDCASTGFLPPEEGYALAGKTITGSGRIVPAFTRLKWPGFLQTPKKRKRARDDEGEKERMDLARQVGTQAHAWRGLLMPAPSLANQGGP